MDRAFVSDPDRALAAARREANRLGDITESLFSRALEMFDADDHVAIERLVTLDGDINARNKSIHRYLSEARRHVREPEQESRIDSAPPLPHAGYWNRHQLEMRTMKRKNERLTLARGLPASTRNPKARPTPALISG